MGKRFIRCIRCNEVILDTEFNTWPEFYVNPETKEVQCIPKDEFKEFLDCHREHRLEILMALEGFFWSDKLYSEPVKTKLYKATNGKEDFTIQGSREKIEDPIEYKIILGNILEKISKIEIDLVAIRKHILAKRPNFNQKMLGHFIRHLKMLTGKMNMGEEDERNTSIYPSESFYLINGGSLVWLKRQLRAQEFGSEKFEEDRNFLQNLISRESGHDGLLNLKVTRTIRLR